MSKIFRDPLLVYKKLYHFITVLFICQELFLFYFVVLSFSALQQFLYNIISDLICQELFNFSFRSDLYCSDRSPSATFIDYHIWSLVSRSFFILFRNQISSDVIFSCRSFSDVDYLTIAVYSMSTAFLCFFDNYFCHPYIVFFFIKSTIYGWHFSFYNRYVIFMVPEI